MAIINARWPLDICPVSCRFGPSRNAVQQRSPYTREQSVIVRGRRLWTADLTWQFPENEKLAKLRYWLEALDGFTGSVQLWDFSNPFPKGFTSAEDVDFDLSQWKRSGVDCFWTWAGRRSNWTFGDNVVLSATAVVGSTQIALTGLRANSIATVRGQYVQVGRRLYLAAEGTVTDGSGRVTVSLQSPLIATAGAGTVARLARAGCEMQLAEQDWDSSGAAGSGLVTVSAKFIETVTDFTP